MKPPPAPRPRGGQVPAGPRRPPPPRRPDAPRTPTNPARPVKAAQPAAARPSPAAAKGDPGTGGRRRPGGQLVPIDAGTGRVGAARPSAATGATQRVPVLSTGMAERLAEQKAMRRHRLMRRALLVTSLVAFVAGATWTVLYSSLLSFDADRLTVDGTGSSVDAAAIVSVVAAHDGTSLALLDTVALRDEILEVPNVRDVALTRQWPSGLAVVVVAREPVAAVPVPEGVALLDQDAVQVGVEPVAPPELPLITIPLTGEERTLEAALVVLNSLPDDLAAEVGSLSASTQDSVTLTLRDGVVVEWGSSHESELKIQVLATLRSAEVSRAARVFDVSAPTFPITR